MVTGAAGFIGSHLTDALLARGDDVVAVDSFTDYYDPQLKRRNCALFEVVEIDLARDPINVADLDGVFHLAGQPGVRPSWSDFDLYVERNVAATRRVFEAAAQHVRVVFASSSSVYGDAEAYPTSEDARPQPISPYGITKLACEHLAHAYARNVGLDWIALRYFTVYGPRQRPDMAFARILRALRDQTSFPLYGDGSQSRGFTYVDDAVAGTIAAMERGVAGSVYNVGGGAEATVGEAMRLAEGISGRTLALERYPAAAGDVLRTAADTTKIARDAGWRATTPLEAGLRRQWEWTVTQHARASV
jgi:nucleoside-diphosphate-sugar epimerase